MVMIIYIYNSHIMVMVMVMVMMMMIMMMIMMMMMRFVEWHMSRTSKKNSTKENLVGFVILLKLLGGLAT